jgi:hypothetical protein
MTRQIILAALAICAMLAPAHATGPHEVALECFDGSRRTVRIVVETCETLAECRRDVAAETYEAKIQYAPPGQSDRALDL